jgi:hypothetical protein
MPVIAQILQNKVASQRMLQTYIYVSLLYILMMIIYKGGAGCHCHGFATRHLLQLSYAGAASSYHRRQDWGWAWALETRGMDG